MVIQFGVRLVSVVYVALGVIGFLPIDALNPFHPEGIGVRYLLHQVAINSFHNLFHLAIGLTGLWAARNVRDARVWGRVWGPTLLLLFVVGMIQAILSGFPPDQLLLGLVPLNSPAHILHATTGGMALYLALKPIGPSPSAESSTAAAFSNK